MQSFPAYRKNGEGVTLGWKIRTWEGNNRLVGEHDQGVAFDGVVRVLGVEAPLHPDGKLVDICRTLVLGDLTVEAVQCRQRAPPKKGTGNCVTVQS